MMKSELVPNAEIFGKGSISEKLPNGYIGPDGTLHNSIVIREMTGVEEDILDQQDKLVTDRISEILTACITKLGTITDKTVIEAAVRDTLLPGQGQALTAQDRIAAMLFLRRATVGDIYKFTRKCPGCNQEARRGLDLKQLTLKGVKDPTKRRVSVTLPRSQKVAILKVLTAKGESQVAELKPTQRDLKTYAIMARLETLDGKTITGSEQDINTIKNLPNADRSQLLAVYQAMEGDIDTDVQVICKNAKCNMEFEFPLDVGQLFFSNQVEKPVAEDLNWL